MMIMDSGIVSAPIPLKVLYRGSGILICRKYMTSASTDARAILLVRMERRLPRPRSPK
jgi:hypothetical protein